MFLSFILYFYHAFYFILLIFYILLCFYFLLSLYFIVVFKLSALDPIRSDLNLKSIEKIMYLKIFFLSGSK